MKRPDLLPDAPARRRSTDVLAYLVIGGLSVATDLALLVLLAEVVGVPLPAAVVIAFLSSVVVNFGLNRLLAGSSGTSLLGRQARRYGLLLVANTVVTVLVVTGAERAGLPYVVGKAAVVLASTAWNYLLYRRWVFAQDEGATATDR